MIGFSELGLVDMETLSSLTLLRPCCLMNVGSTESLSQFLSLRDFVKGGLSCPVKGSHLPIASQLSAPALTESARVPGRGC